MVTRWYDRLVTTLTLVLVVLLVVDNGVSLPATHHLAWRHEPLVVWDAFRIIILAAGSVLAFAFARLARFRFKHRVDPNSYGLALIDILVVLAIMWMAIDQAGRIGEGVSWRLPLSILMLVLGFVGLKKRSEGIRTEADYRWLIRDHRYRRE